MDRAKLDKSTVDSLKPVPGKQVIYWDADVPGFGIRVSPKGSKAFFYQGRLQGKNIKVPIGRYGDMVAIGKGDAAQVLPLTVVNARKKLAEIRGELVQGKDPRMTRPAKPITEGAHDTLGDLLEAYCDVLENQGKVSAGKVRTELKKDIETAHPKLWAKRAADVSVDDCMMVVGDLYDAGTPRQADKIRSYLQTAYRKAINSPRDVTATKVMRDLHLSDNPARDIEKVQGSDNPNKRILSLSEFRAYWDKISDLAEPRRSVAMLHVLTGGQRMVQLARVTLADVDRDSMTMTLRDIKGRRTEPRVYQIPLLPEALALIDGITGSGHYVFSADGGSTPMSDQFLSDIASTVCTAMEKAGELQGTPFTGKHIRATVESRLMDKPYRVSSDVLARLLSHGLGGVQARSYAKDPLQGLQQEALEKLWRLVNNLPEPVAQVVQFKATA